MLFSKISSTISQNFTKMSRPLNPFESFFASNNIRFTVALKLPCEIADTDIVTTVSKHLVHHPLFSCTINKTSNSLVPRTSPLTSQVIRTIEHDDATLQTIATQLIGITHDDISVTYVRDQNIMVFDFAHAFLDARAVQQFIGSITKSLNKQTFEINDYDGLKYNNEDWAVLVKNTLFKSINAKVEQNEDEKEGNKYVSIFDVLGKGEQHKQDDILLSFNADLLSTIRYNFSVFANNDDIHMTKPTLTALWTFALGYALAYIHQQTSSSSSLSRTNNHELTYQISVLTDIRPFLHVSDMHLRQAIATLPVIFTSSSSSTINLKDLSTHEILHIVSAMTKSLHNNLIETSMPLRSAHALCTNNEKEIQKYAGTIELSNHGVYDVPKGTKVLVTQRFDSYEGVSVMVWTNGNGEMSAMVSYAKVKTERVIEMTEIVKTVMDIAGRKLEKL